MESIVSYFLQANLYLSLFFLCYLFFLRHDTFFRRNRYYLLASLVFSISFPLIQLPDFAKESVTQMVENSTLLEGVTIFANTPSPQEASFSWGWRESLLSVYALGALVFSFIFLKSLLGILGLAIKHGIRRENGVWVVRLDDSWQPFSFFSLLFWTDQPDMEEEEKKQVWQHELAHIGQWHSIDIILFELLGIVFWFNPVCLMYKQAIRQVHEYLADAAVAGHHADKSAYATLLLGQFFAVRQLHLSNHFMNKHFLKRRIMMLNQSKTSQTAMYKLLLALPIVIACLFIQACSEKILEPSTKTAQFTPIKSYNLGKAPSGQSTVRYTLVLSKNTTYHIYSPEDNPIDFKKTAWTLHHVDQKTYEVLEEIVSWKQGDKVIPEVVFDAPETGLYYMTFQSIDSQPLEGQMMLEFYRREGLKQAPIDVQAYLANFKPIKEADLTGPMTFTIDVKEGSLLMKISGTADNPKPAEGWSVVLYDMDGKKKATNLFDGRYFDNFAYKSDRDQQMKVVIEKEGGAMPDSRIVFSLQEFKNK